MPQENNELEEKYFSNKASMRQREEVEVEGRMASVTEIPMLLS
jgi:hypothetical protein